MEEIGWERSEGFDERRQQFVVGFACVDKDCQGDWIITLLANVGWAKQRPGVEADAESRWVERLHSLVVTPQDEDGDLLEIGVDVEGGGGGLGV